MKKLFALLTMAVMMTFAACSDSDEEAAWKQLPTEPIPGDNAMLTVNGGSTTGSVQLTATSTTQGTLFLTNVLPGYAEISMDVTLSGRTDGTFDITGEKGLTTAPSMISRADAESVIFNISVSGNVTPEGKATVNLISALSTEAQGGLAGTWDLLSEVKLKEDDGAMTIAPLWVTWSALDPAQANAEGFARGVGTFGSMPLYQVLHSVTFSTDGNIMAEYWSGNVDLQTAIFQGTVTDQETLITTFINIHEDEPWLESPRNLAFWYVKGDNLYVVPNITAILAQVGKDSGSSVDTGNLDISALLSKLGEYDITLTAELLSTVTGWLQTGIPLKYVKSNGALKLYVDKEMCSPIIEALLPALPKLDEMIAKLIAENPDDQSIQMLPMFLAMLQIKNFADLEPIWNNNTDEFEISLNLTDSAL
ncbi:DUF4925 domain-containing protein [Parabacteroides johnsonii]|uniref:DUF4925 domain-containing protein n=1 Tax=Parabacteroides johnsonii TaxID=387661 RepID=UPI0026DBEF2F|nr:DUF4925 domain-containing protein [Parabacteroides johnsonii]